MEKETLNKLYETRREKSISAEYNRLMDKFAEEREKFCEKLAKIKEENWKT